MEKIKKLEAKRILSEYSFVKTNEEYIEEIISLNTPKFLKEINDLMKDLGISNNQQNKNNTPNKNKQKIYDTKDFHISTINKMKKIYREIVKITHPDKVTDPDLNSVYISAKEAYRNNDVMELFYICNHLNIEVEIENYDILTFNKIIEEKKKKSKSTEKSYLWLWVNSESDEGRLDIVKMFINNNYNQNI